MVRKVSQLRAEYTAPDGRQHRIRLHTYVWEKHNGPVPDGYEIHHIDRNTDNNEIENLVMLTVEEHRDHHDNRQQWCHRR